MLFVPKNTKYRKQRKGKNFNLINKFTSINSLSSGVVGLKAIDSGKLTSNHIFTCRQCINKVIKKAGQLIIKIIADTPVSKKPLEIRMGKGKGNVDHWVSKINSGRILFEIETNSIQLGIKALKIAQLKLPINTKIIQEVK